jgi:hypothetical protein
MNYLKKYEELNLKNLFSRKKKVQVPSSQDVKEESPKEEDTKKEESPKEKEMTIDDIFNSIESPQIESIEETEEGEKGTYRVKFKDSFIKPLLSGTIFEDIYTSTCLTIECYNLYRGSIRYSFSIYTTESIRKKLGIEISFNNSSEFFHNSGEAGITQRDWFDYHNGDDIVNLVTDIIQNMKSKISNLDRDIKALLKRQQAQIKHQSNWEAKLKEFFENEDDITDCFLELEDMSLKHSVKKGQNTFFLQYEIEGISVEPTNFSQSSYNKYQTISHTFTEAKFYYNPILSDVFIVLKDAHKRLSSLVPEAKMNVSFYNNNVSVKIFITYKSYQHEED